MFKPTQFPYRLYGVSACLAMLLLAFFALSAPVFAMEGSDNPFRVEDIAVDVTAENAVKAREKAFKDATMKSIPVLLKQLKDSGYEVQRLSGLNKTQLANMVQDFEISNEQISDVRYKANLTFDYNKKKLNTYLNAAYAMDNAPYPSGTTYSTDMVSPAYHEGANPNKALQRAQGDILVLPFLQIANAPLKLWGEDNLWMTTWRAKPSARTVIPIGDLTDMRDIRDNQALTYDAEALNRLVARYAADRAVILLASYTNAPFPTNMSEVNRGRLNVALYDTIKTRPQFVDQVTLNPIENESLGNFLARAKDETVALFARLQPLPQQELVPQNVVTQDNMRPSQSVAFPSQTTTTTTSQIYTTGATQSLRARAQYNSIQQWMSLQQQVRSIPGVSGLQILSLRPREADILVSYQGAPDAISSQLRAKGLALEVR